MKKIFTLLFAVGIISVASAQQAKQINRSGKQETKTIKVKAGDHGRGVADSYSFTLKQEQVEISRINRMYDQKIAIIQRSRSARTAAMGRKVRQLEDQRNAELRAVGAKYDHVKNTSRTHAVAKTGRSDKW